MAKVQTNNYKRNQQQPYVYSSSFHMISCRLPSTIKYISAFTPPAPNDSMRDVNRTAVVSVTTKDNRETIQESASYTKTRELIKLSKSTSITQLFQQVMQQNLISKGFRIGQLNGSNAWVTLDLREFGSKQNKVIFVINSIPKSKRQFSTRCERFA